MTRTRLYLNQDLKPDHMLKLDKDQNHYLTKVLRLKQGDSLLVFNGKAGEWHAVLGPKAMHLMCQKISRAQPVNSEVEILFAPVKRAGTHMILEKATELGVGVFSPVKTERTVASDIHLRRWHTIIREAAEQTERLDLPEINPFITLKVCLKNWPEERGLLVCDEGRRGFASESETLKQPNLASGCQVSTLSDLENYQKKHYKKTSLLIGPEGGFTQKEQALLYQYDFVHPLSLGANILRAETAVISALSLYQAFLGSWSKLNVL